MGSSDHFVVAMILYFLFLIDNTNVATFTATLLYIALA